MFSKFNTLVSTKWNPKIWVPILIQVNLKLTMGFKFHTSRVWAWIWPHQFRLGLVKSAPNTQVALPHGMVENVGWWLFGNFMGQWATHTCKLHLPVTTHPNLPCHSRWILSRQLGHGFSITVNPSKSMAVDACQISSQKKVRCGGYKNNQNVSNSLYCCVSFVSPPCALLISLSSILYWKIRDSEI